jgi:hypothetical protein
LVVAVILSGVILASAATLEVDGGVLQGFRFEADVTSPVTTTDSVSGDTAAAQPGQLVADPEAPSSGP